MSKTMKNDNQAMVPRLRFPEFRNAGEWKSAFGDNVFDQICNKEHNSDLAVLAITQEHGAIPRDMIDYHVSVTDKSIEGYKVVDIGDFIISLRSFQGGIEYSRFKGICSPAYVILRLRKGHSADYFRQFLKTDRFISQMTKNLEGLRDGKMVSYKQFSELSLPIPFQKEQQKIADCLSSIDDLISAQTQKIESLKAHKKGLMQQLFPTEGETLPNLRFPEFRDTVKWKKMMVEELFQESIEKGYPKKTVLSATQDRGVIPCNLLEKSVIRDPKNLIGYKLVKRGDFVISLRSFEGGFEYSYFEGIISPAYVILRRKKEINDRFCQISFKSYAFIAAIKNSLNNNLRDGKSISYNQAKELELIIPSLSEQQKIADCLSSIDDLIAAHTQKLDALKVHKKGLMQQLFPALDEMQR